MKGSTKLIPKDTSPTTEDTAHRLLRREEQGAEDSVPSFGEEKKGSAFRVNMGKVCAHCGKAEAYLKEKTPISKTYECRNCGAVITYGGVGEDTIIVMPKVKKGK